MTAGVTAATPPGAPAEVGIAPPPGRGKAGRKGAPPFQLMVRPTGAPIQDQPARPRKADSGPEPQGAPESVVPSALEPAQTLAAQPGAQTGLEAGTLAPARAETAGPASTGVAGTGLGSMGSAATDSAPADAPVAMAEMPAPGLPPALARRPQLAGPADRAATTKANAQPDEATEPTPVADATTSSFAPLPTPPAGLQAAAAGPALRPAVSLAMIGDPAPKAAAPWPESGRRDGRAPTPAPGVAVAAPDLQSQSLPFRLEAALPRDAAAVAANALRPGSAPVPAAQSDRASSAAISLPDIRIALDSDARLDVAIATDSAALAERVEAGREQLLHDLAALGTEVETIRVEVRPVDGPDGAGSKAFSAGGSAGGSNQQEGQPMRESGHHQPGGQQPGGSGSRAEGGERRHGLFRILAGEQAPARAAALAGVRNAGRVDRYA
jgi:hypothetical protein